MSTFSLNDITIRTNLEDSDVETIVKLHNEIYQHENSFGDVFESYVREALKEFIEQYDSATNRAWIAEHDHQAIGFIFLMNRGKAAQLRFFLIDPKARGIGLGNKLMNLFMEFLHKCGYASCYLWTVDELPVAAHLYVKFGFKLVEEVESIAFGKKLMEQKYELVL